MAERRSERFAAVMLRITTANLGFGDFRTANRTCFSDLDTLPTMLRKPSCGAERFTIGDSSSHFVPHGKQHNAPERRLSIDFAGRLRSERFHSARRTP